MSQTQTPPTPAGAPLFEYAPAPESRAIVEIKPSYDLFIGGAFVPATGGSLKTVNPATEEVLAEFGVASTADVDRAVSAARQAYDTISSRLPRSEPPKYLYQISRS